MDGATVKIILINMLNEKRGSVGCLLALIVSILLFATCLLAEDRTFIHNPINAKDLPFPGKLMNISVKIPGQISGKKMRLILVKDGRLTEIKSDSAVRNEKDEPIYNFPVYAPISELSYQFFLYDQDGSVKVSRRFAIRRACIPSLELSDTKAREYSSGEAQIVSLVEQARGLDRDLEQYEKVLSLLDELKSLIKE